MDEGANGISWQTVGTYDSNIWTIEGAGDFDGNGDGSDDILMGASGSDYIGARLVEHGAVNGWMTVAS